MKRLILSCALITIIPLSVSAVVFGGTNFSFSGYPSHSCYKPTKPHKPYSLDSQWEVDNYNSEIESYNNQRQQYVSCINEYVDNAQNDIKRIRESAQGAIDEASM